eukprot:6173646-Pleurochrysis_carterae.AAC.1
MERRGRAKGLNGAWAGGREGRTEERTAKEEETGKERKYAREIRGCRGASWWAQAGEGDEAKRVKEMEGKPLVAAAARAPPLFRRRRA